MLPVQDSLILPIEPMGTANPYSPKASAASVKCS